MIHDGALILNQEFLGHKRALTKIKVPLKKQMKMKKNEEKNKSKQSYSIQWQLLYVTVLPMLLALTKNSYIKCATMNGNLFLRILIIK